jgi:hypothetical protein
MPPKGNVSEVMRIVIGVAGRVKMRTELVIRFDYGATVPWVTRLEDGTLRAIAGPQMLLLKTPVSIHGEDLKTIGEFTVDAGDQARVSLGRQAIIRTARNDRQQLPEPCVPLRRRHAEFG